jgi:Tfp pilus assembly PilM family ATPase
MAIHVGVELSSSFFKLVEVKKKRKNMELLQYVVHPLPSVWAESGTFLDREELIQTIQEALLGRRLNTKRVHVSIHCRHVLFKRVMLPEMRKRKYRRWIEKYLIPVLDLPFSDPVFDFRLLDHVWEDGDQQEVFLALISQSYIDSFVRCFQYCGLDPVHIDLAPFGLYRWIHYHRSFQTPHTLMIQISKQDVEVSHFIDRKLERVYHLHLPMTSFADHEDRPHPDPLHPLLKEKQEVERYGKRLMEQILEKVSGKERKWLKSSRAEWFLSGEGLDFYLLENWLQQHLEASVKLAPSAEIIMPEPLRDRASKWLGNALSIPIGLTVDEKEGMGP